MKSRGPENQQERRTAVAAGARWMDRKYPAWYRGVVDVVKQGNFDIGDAGVCVIGAGTGHHWSEEESNLIQNSVCRATGLNADGLTASTAYEAFWVAEAFQRAGAMGER